MRARLQRNLDFRAVALSELVSVLTFAFTVTLLLFWRPELGVLIPVLGSVVRELGLFSSLALSARWLPRLRFRLQALRQILRFALNLTGSRVVALLNTKIAYVFIFVPLGATAQAYYSLAERLTLQPLTRLATTIQRVSFPTFSTIVDDDSLLRRGYLSSVQGFVLALGPVLAGIFVFAPEIAALLNTEPMWMVLRLLAAATLLKVASTLVGSIFMAKGKTNWSFYWSLFSMGVLIPALYFYGLPRGVEGVASVIAAAALLFLLLSQYPRQPLDRPAFCNLSRRAQPPRFGGRLRLHRSPAGPPPAALVTARRPRRRCDPRRRRDLNRPLPLRPQPLPHLLAEPARDLILPSAKIRAVWGCFGICF